MHMKIGEFAALGHVSVRMLRYYDKHHLLTPDYTDSETGFRYYLPEQLTTLHRIRDLQQLGFTLREINSLLQSDDIDHLHEQLWEQQQKLLREMQERQRQIQELQYRLNHIETQNTCTQPTFTVTSIPTETIIHVRDTLQEDEDNIADGFNLCMAYLRQNQITVLKGMGIKHYLYDGSHDFEWAFQLGDMNFQRLRIADGWELTRKQFPATQIASIWVQGSYAQSAPTQCQFKEWARYHGYKLAGAVRENYVRLVDNDIHHPDNLMEMQFPIGSAV